jgi:hypothetical protein
MALVHDLQVLDADLPETEHDSGLEVIITLPNTSDHDRLAARPLAP